MAKELLKEVLESLISAADEAPKTEQTSVEFVCKLHL